MSAVDIIAIRQPDGTIKSTPFCVLFSSKKPSEVIHIEINGEVCSNITMTAHKTGEIYFSPIATRKSTGGADQPIITLRELDEEDLGRQEAEPNIHKKIVEEQRLLQFEVAEENQIFKGHPPLNKSASIDAIRNRSVENLVCKPPKVPKNESESNIHTSPVVSARLISRSGSSPVVVAKDTTSLLNNSEKKSSPKPLARNGSLNSIFFWKNNSKKVSPNGSKSGDVNKKDDANNSTNNDNDVVLTKTPLPDQLATMRLKDGENLIKFVCGDKQTATAKLFLWNHDVKIIVSDIDGTITKTDKRGLFYYKFGYDWTHDKVVDLYKTVNNQGYQFVYLTARSVKTSTTTRSYLDKIGCPVGPVLSAPHSYIGCVTTELWKTTAAGKLSHLKPLKSLFREGADPIVAGFGNKVHDHVCYQEIKIPAERIFIINKQSEVTVNGTKTSYDTLLQTACTVFPSVLAMDMDERS